MAKSKQIEKPIETGYTDKRKKTLINLGEHRKEWVKRVVELTGQAGNESNQTEIINVCIDQQMIKDPEAFVNDLQKFKLRARLTDIERRKAALQAEEDQLTNQIEHGGLVNVR